MTPTMGTATLKNLMVATNDTRNILTVQEIIYKSPYMAIAEIMEKEDMGTQAIAGLIARNIPVDVLKERFGEVYPDRTIADSDPYQGSKRELACIEPPITHFEAAQVEIVENSRPSVPLILPRAEK